MEYEVTGYKIICIFIYCWQKNKLKISFNILYQKHKILLSLLKDMQDLDNQDQKYC